ncbi:MAG: hypothetical protein HC887_10175 [Desulfobacteraceae bacterium]|nr:hypothetical protein [Desulfobacteraceae bacterium]
MKVLKTSLPISPSGGVAGGLPSTWGSVQTFTIADDDPGPTVSLAIGTPQTIMESGPGYMNMTLTLSSNGNYAKNTSGATEIVYVDLGGTASFGTVTTADAVTSGQDYYVADTLGNTVGLVNGKLALTIPRGQSKVDYRIYPLDDNSAGGSWGKYFEGNESINVSLGNYSNGTYLSNLTTSTTAFTASATIIDDDPAPRTVSLVTVGGTDINEGSSRQFEISTGSSFFPTTVTLSFAGAATLAKDGIHTDGFPANPLGEDYGLFTANGPFTAGLTTGDQKYVFVIPSSNAATTIPLYLSAYDDNIYEGNETLTVAIDSVFGGIKASAERQ